MLKTKIIIAGDTLPMPCNYDLFSAGDTKALFGDRLCELFASADYRVCNLEGCFTDSDTPVDKIGPAIHAPTASIKGIKALGIDYAVFPGDGYYNMDVAEASACAQMVNARHSIPVHLVPMNDPNDPSQLFDREKAERFKASGRIILEPGQTLDLEPMA